MPAQPPGVWGIDLGQCGLKAIRLQMEDGQVVATAYDYVEHPKILSQPDADPDQLTREALEKFLQRNNLRGDTVAIGIPGQSGLARFVKLPPVEEKKIGDIVRFEAKQQIPFNLEEVVWDYQKLGSGTVTDGFAMETEIGLFAIKRDMVARALQHFTDVGIEVHLVQMSPLALCNFAAFDLLGRTPGAEPTEGGEEKKCVVVLDIGTDSSNLVITDGDRIIWQRPIPLGGNHFTRALTKDLKLTFAKAEHIKRNATKSPDLKKILASLKPVLNDFVGEVQRSLGYFTNTHRDAQIEYMMGLGNAFRLPGLQRFLSEKLQLEVRKLGKMEKMTGDAVVGQQVFTENILTFPVAYGLALQGLGQTKVTTNLLPPEIRTERMIRGKKPWAVAAAACLLLGTAALGLSYALEYRTYNDPRVGDAMKKSEGVVKQVTDSQTKFKKAKDDANEQAEAVKSIIAGQMERTDWLELLKFVSKAVPLPDGSNLPPSGKRYWDQEPDRQNHPQGREALTGQEAYKLWLMHFRNPGEGGGGRGDSEGLTPGIDDLIQVNIEGISNAFCDDLGAYWKQVKTDINNESGAVRPEKDFNKPPQGKGWVVEVRGYTFHHGHDAFVINTFVENLARLAGEPKTAEPAGDTKPGATQPPAPGGTPPAEAPPGGAKPAEEKPEEKKKEKPEDLPAVVGHVSHVVLLKYEWFPGEDNTTSSLASSTQVIGMTRTGGGGGLGTMSGLNTSKMSGLGSGGATPPAGGPTGAMPSMPGGATPPGGAAPGGGATDAAPAAPSGPGRETWMSLDSESGGMAGGRLGSGGPMAPGGAAPGGKMSGMVPPGGAPKMPSMPSGSGGPGGAGGPGGMMPGARPGMPQAGGTSGGSRTASRRKRGRSEFVIQLIWKEDTPSDALRGQQEAAADAQAPSPAPGLPSMPGGGAMPSMPGGMTPPGR
jgi:type IV pilus assembly protein PilM